MTRRRPAPTGVICQRSMVDVPTPGSVEHPGVVIIIRDDGFARIARVARGTGNPHRSIDEALVAEYDRADPSSDAAVMGLAKDTYFYADEILWVPVEQLTLRRGECPEDFWNGLREIDPIFQTAVLDVDTEDASEQ